MYLMGSMLSLYQYKTINQGKYYTFKGKKMPSPLSHTWGASDSCCQNSVFLLQVEGQTCIIKENVGHSAEPPLYVFLSLCQAWHRLISTLALRTPNLCVASRPSLPCGAFIGAAAGRVAESRRRRSDRLSRLETGCG